jgi:hypothetical protein
MCGVCVDIDLSVVGEMVVLVGMFLFWFVPSFLSSFEEFSVCRVEGRK